MNGVFETAQEYYIQTSGSFQELQYPFQEINAGQIALP